MKLRTLVFVALLFTAAAVVPNRCSANDGDRPMVLPAGEHPLLKITPLALGSARYSHGNKVYTYGECGEYFRTMVTPIGTHLVQVLGPLFPGDPPTSTTNAVYNPKHYTVEFVDKAAPTLEYTVQLGRPRIILRISYAEYDRSCLKSLGIK